MPDPALREAAPLVSLVLAVRDGWDRTFQLLLGLVAQGRGIAHETIVVDEASSDETSVALPLLEGLRVVRSEERLGLFRALALGAARARGRYLVFLRPGLEPGPGWLAALLAAAEADPAAAAVGSARRDGAGRPLPPSADGLLVRAEAFEEVGGFDAAFREGGAGVDLGSWLGRRGGRLVVSAGAALTVSEPAAAPSEPAPPLELGAGDLPTPSFPYDPADATSGWTLESAGLLPNHDGTYELEVRGRRGGREVVGRARPRTAEPREVLELAVDGGGPPLRLSRSALLSCLAHGYDLAAAARRARAQLAAGPLRVAFTILRPDLVGGGSINAFRWVNWLADMGAEVAVYSPTLPPAWGTVNARFHPIPVSRERYRAITEPVVVVGSVVELPALLRCDGARDKLVLHLCQGAEEFHYGSEPPADPPAPNAAFELLDAIPVARLVVSPHLRDHFARRHGQRALLVTNGVDLELFRPGPRTRRRASAFTVMTSGNPAHALKGARWVEEALALLAARRPDWALHLVQVCGGAPEAPSARGCGEAPSARATAGFTLELRQALSGPEMREQYLAADAYVNASWYEGFGLPSLEAMACGTPVVQARNRGLDGLVEDGRDCLQVPVADPGAIAGALERLFSDAALCDHLVQGGLATAAGLSLDAQRAALADAFSGLTGVDLRPPAPRVAAGRASPLFSVLVPSYNQAHLVEETLASLRAQTDPDWEALVVDDGSTDSTPQVLDRQARRDPRLRTFRQPNGGVAAALNRGLAAARGEWICWLSSDDLWRPDKLAFHREVMRRDPGARFLHTNYELLHHASGRIVPSGIAVAEFIPPLDQQSLRFLHVNYVNGITIALHRSVFEAVGRFDEGFRYGQDFDLWLRASARHRLRYDDRVTAVTRLHPGQGTAQFSEAGIFDSARAGAAFLASHDLEALFPTLELSQPDQALRAVSAALHVALHPQSFITCCGLAPLLLDRLEEWLARAPAGVRRPIQQQLARAALALTSPPARQVVQALAVLEPGAFRWQPSDPLELLARRADLLARHGDERGHAALRRYLAMVASLPRAARAS